MINTQKIKMRRRLQVKLSQYVEKLSKELTKPKKKFLKEMVGGILATQKPIVRQIGQHLDESIPLKKTTKRLRYNLSSRDLNRQLSNTNARSICHSFNKDTLVIVDPSDIAKKYAEAMEGLSRVRDGSENKIVNGYDTLNILSVNRHNKANYSHSLLFSDLYSYTKELDSLKNKLFDRILSIIIYGNNKGIFTFDSGYDDRKVFKFLSEHDAPFIIRSNGKRGLYINGKPKKFKDVIKDMKLKYKFKLKRKKNTGKETIESVSCGITDVQIPVNPHKLKHPTLISVKLFVGRYDNDGGYWYILFSLPQHTELSEVKLTEFVLRSYKVRWKIEEVHRHIKTKYHWEDIQLNKYNRLKLLNTIFWIAIGFIYRLKTLKYAFIKSFKNIMLAECKSIHKIPSFIYYRISKIVRLCFQMLGYYKNNYHKKPKEHKDQIMLPNF